MKKIVSLFVLVCGLLSMQAQVITLGVSSQTSVTGCSVSVYDNGGIGVEMKTLEHGSRW